MNFRDVINEFMMRFIKYGLCVIFICAYSSSNAQTISKAEYFFDTDPGPGNGTALSFTPGNPVTFTGSISTTGLPPGYHFLFIRTKTSSGHWSLYEPRRFFIDGGIIEAEYFFDVDPGIGNGTPLTVSSSSTITSAIPTTGLSDGVHYLFIRTKHDGNIWSLAEPRYLNIRTRIVEAEYFIDTDPGFGNGTPLSISVPSDLINFTPTITTPGTLADGDHYLFIRTKDIVGKWSHFEPQIFTVDAALPIELSDFVATATRDGRIRLQWTTATEINNDFFTVEHAAPQTEFNELFDVPGAGMSTRKIDYEKIHENPNPGLNYYRLKQTDFDGTFSYSKVVSASVNKVTSVYPNPIKDKWTIEFGDGGADTKFLEILNLTGQKIAQYKTNQTKAEFTNDGISSGNYILKIIFPDARTEFLKINFQ